MALKKRLLAVQGPQQFIAGLIAMEWYGRQVQPEADYHSVLVMYDFYVPEHLEPEFAMVITELAAVCQWDKVVFVSGEEMRVLMRQRYTLSTAAMRELLEVSEFDEIHIARNFLGDGSPLILNAYPDSARIIYGDAFGLVGNESLFGKFNWHTPVVAATSACKAFVKAKLYGTHQRLEFDTAVLTLPLDWSGHFLDKLPLMVPEREFVQGKIKQFSDALPALNAYEDRLLGCARINFLFLLSNLSASGYMTEQAEIDLYCDLVTELAPTDARILFKAHPRAPEQIISGVVSRLAERYGDIKIIDDLTLSRFPVELWMRLLRSSTIVPVFSTSAINLKYFYNQGVLLPLTPALMAKYCYPDKLSSFEKANRIISESVDHLDHWDQRSVLWKG